MLKNASVISSKSNYTKNILKEQSDDLETKTGVLDNFLQNVVAGADKYEIRM